ncbi:MAG: UDP-N-acetylglucosamine 1-carboxyvinyltransferase, partial [Filifactor alocis]
NGVSKLYGSEVVATDLRAGAALIISGLIAKGTTKVRNIYHVDRGYVDIVGKLSKLGANISRVED